MRAYFQGIAGAFEATGEICDAEMLRIRATRHANEIVNEQRAERPISIVHRLLDEQL